MLAFAQPSAAQDDDGTSDTEQVALLTYLGLTAADGSLSVGDGSGGVEGQIIASILMQEAAEEIVGQLADHDPGAGATNPYGAGERVVLLAGNETFTTAAYHRLRRQVGLISTQLRAFEAAADDRGCDTPAPALLAPGDGPGVLGVMTPGGAEAVAAADESPFDFRVSDLLGALRTSTNLQNVPVTLGDQMLRNALINQPARPSWILQSEITDFPASLALETELDGYRSILLEYVEGKCDSMAVSEANKPKIKEQASALLNAILALYAAKDGAPSLVDQTAQSASLMNGQAEAPRALRVSVESAGGTLIRSQNILTSFFVPGVTMRGGLVVSYRTVNATNGTSDLAGALVCRFPLRVLRSLTSEPLDELRARATRTLDGELCTALSTEVAGG
ncbi:hypothetical protein [Aurantiacibacter gilvus]|uniref:Curli production assembly/transport component CsgG n=1 Tax=Aurantiacibacter gilvus TaxID=3139141 RepID=A0ABU9IE20_9SPHN